MKNNQKHINNCNKIVCNCKLFEDYTNNQIDKKFNNVTLNNYISKYINILNYLFECAFIDYDYYKSFDLVILLAEHFCHLKNNPIMSFSFINTFMMNKKNKFNKLQLVKSKIYLLYIGK